MTQTYTFEEVRQASIEYFRGDELAAEVFADKYALRDPKGNIFELTPAQMHQRLAREFAAAEKKYPNPLSYERILRLFSSWDVVPQGSPMSAVGNGYQYQSLSNCFVIQSPYDSYGGILKADQEQAQIMKRRGGVGFDISTIRPRGMYTSNAARTTDGIGVFMERFSRTCREVAQGGRRGALMLTLSIHHPEVRTFIEIKRDMERKKVKGANVSLRLTDEFMEAVESGGKVQLRFPVDPSVEHVIEEEVDAAGLFNDIVEAAHDCAEPGLLFWDTIRRRGPADAYPQFKSTATNPCGEITLSPYDSCRLLLVNLANFVTDPFVKEARFDHERFDAVVRDAQRLMDDLVDMEIAAVDRIIGKVKLDPEPEDVKEIELRLWTKIRAAAVEGRRTGLGITGLGDALAMVGVRYGSNVSIEITEDIYRHLAVNSYRSSVTMAKERGAFPAFSLELEKGHPFIEQVIAEDNALREDYLTYGRRNIANTTTAPAGSTSILTQTTSGGEPAFNFKYGRRRKVTDVSIADEVDSSGDAWQFYEVFHHGFQRWMDVTGKEDPEESPYWGATADSIDWVKKIEMQAAAQRWVCHSISNTTNLPEDVPIDLVKKIYMHGWKTGCKGVTIYREGSRDDVLINGDKTTVLDENGLPLKVVDNHAPKRPKELPCDILRTTVKGEAYMVLVGLLGDRPYEVFCGLSENVEVPRKIKRGVLVKNGKVDGITAYDLRIPIGDDDELVIKNIVKIFDNPVYGAFTRTLSLAMRHGVPIQYIVEQLRKDKNSDMMDFSKVMARMLSKHYIPDGACARTFEKKCSNCGSDELAYQSGCVTCMTCGSSKCY